MSFQRVEAALRCTENIIHLDAGQLAGIISVFKSLRSVAPAYDCNQHCDSD